MDNLNEEIDLILLESLTEEEGTERQIALNRLRLSKAKNAEEFYKIYKRLLQLTGKDDQLPAALRASASEGASAARYISGFGAAPADAKTIRIRFLKVYASIISKIKEREPAPEEEEEEEGGEEPEETGTGEEPEEIGTEEPEETAPAEPRALTPEERTKLAQNIETATEWMAKRLVLMGPEYYNDVGTLRKQGRIIQKYFIQTREIREEDTSGSTPSSRTTPSARGGTGSDAADMLRLLSRKKLITPEESNRHLEDLKEKVEPDALEHKWREHVRADDDATTHFKTTKALIQKYTVEGLSEAVVLKEDKIVEIVIDFNELREKRLDESFLAMFGGWVEHLLKAMFGGYKVPVNIRGSRAEVESFASALGGEKRYIDAAKRYGLDHPTTYKNKAKLETAIKGFEKDTGLVWPYR